MPPPVQKHVPGFVFRRRRIDESVGSWVLAGITQAIVKSMTNIYFWANIVFLSYSIGASVRGLRARARAGGWGAASALSVCRERSARPQASSSSTMTCTPAPRWTIRTESSSGERVCRRS